MMSCRVVSLLLVSCAFLVSWKQHRMGKATTGQHPCLSAGSCVRLRWRDWLGSALLTASETWDQVSRRVGEGVRLSHSPFILFFIHREASFQLWYFLFNFFIFFFEWAPCPVWCLNSWPWNQESHALPAEPASCSKLWCFRKVTVYLIFKCN